MEFEEIVVLVNRVAVERKGRPLKDVERLVLKGSWENKTYSAMATPAAGYTEDYLKKDVGPKLWQLLSDLVDSDRRGIRVTKRNLQNVLQTWVAQTAEPAPGAGVSDLTAPAPERPNRVQETLAIAVQDGAALPATVCHGREAELRTLSEWMVTTGGRMVVLWGLPGVGKTTLVTALAAAVAPHFDRCGYLAVPASMGDGALVATLGHWLAPAVDQRQLAPAATVDALIERLSQQRILLVIDSLEELFDPQRPAGHFRAPAIQRLFRQGADRPHRSCLVWVSREKPVEMAQIPPSQGLELALGDLSAATAQRLLQHPNTSTAAGAALVERYGGHPLVLREIGTTLRDVYQGHLEALLQVPGLLLPETVEHVFSQGLQRLLPEEWGILYWLVLAHRPLALGEIQPGLAPTAAVQSLLGRGWVTGTVAPGGLVLDSPPLVRLLVIKQLQGVLLAEIEAESFHWFHRLPLRAPGHREVAQSGQHQGMVVDLGDRLRQHYGSIADLQAKGDRLLASLDSLRDRPGYGASNLLRLFQYLGLNASGANFSRLTLWGADLRRLSLQGANLSQVQFSDTLLATALGQSPVAALAWVKGGGDRTARPYLAAGDRAGRLLIWDLDRGQLVWLWEQGADQGVRALAFSPQGDLLAVGTEAGQIWLWPVGATYLTDLLEVHTAPVGALAFSPDAAQLASGDDQGNLKLWEVASGAEQGQLVGQRGAVHSLAYSATGEALVSASDRHACLWAVGDRSLVHELQGRSTTTLYAAGFLPDPADPGRSPMPFAAGHDDRCLTLWQLDTSLPCWLVPTPAEAVLAMAVSPDGRYLACSRPDLTFEVWHIPDRRVHHTSHLEVPVWSVAFSDDSQWYGLGRDCTLEVWHVHGSQPERSFVNPVHRVQCLTLGGDSAHTTVVTGHDQAHLRCWSMGSGTAPTPRHFSGHSGTVRAVALSADGQWLASSAEDQAVRLWSVASGQCQWAAAAPAPVPLLAFDPKGQWIAAADGGITLRAISTGAVVEQLDDSPDNPSALAIGSSGRWIAVGTKDGSIGLWQRGQPERHRTLSGQGGQILSLAFGPEETLLASSSHNGTVGWWAHDPRGESGGQDRALGRWRPSPDHWLRGVVVTQAAQVVAITTQDCQVDLWDVRADRHLRTLKGHSQGVWQVVANPEGTHLLTIDQNDELRLWILDGGLCQHTLHPSRAYEGTSFRGATGLSDTERQMLRSLGAIF